MADIIVYLIDNNILYIGIVDSLILASLSTISMSFICLF